MVTITFVVFGQTLGHDFVNYDDNKYVYENPVVAAGLTWKGIGWALSYGEIGHWHPLTWLTHMADVQVFGLWAGGHHLTSVVLQALAAVLLFLALREMTGSFWRSGFVAAVFAIHPLRVESVAWIAERKDVLSGVFFMLTLWAYARYAKQPSVARYTAVVVWFGVGLLAKNTLVPLPFLLLLLDGWPLRRRKPFWGLVAEKIPLFLLSIGSCVATLLAPEKITEAGRIPFVERLGNAVVSYAVYLRQMFYPAGLAVPYPAPPGGQPGWTVALALALLMGISAGALACRKRHPYLVVGWLWYLGMLAPAIGVVQISYYAHADRYTYLPGIGLTLAVAWAAAEWSAGWKYRAEVLGGGMVAVIGALMVCAWIQTGYWKNSETLWSRVLACTQGNAVAHYNLGFALMEKGNEEDALRQYQEALQSNPRYEAARNNLGLALLQKGSVDAAVANFQEEVRYSPDSAEAHYNLGNALRQKGRTAAAIVQFQQALRLDPLHYQAHDNLGNAFLHEGKVDEAILQYQQALQINPSHSKTLNNLGNALLQKGRVAEAIPYFQQALRLDPADGTARANLSQALKLSPAAQGRPLR